MGKITKIEWTRDPRTGKPGATYNPWYGCHKCSTGCLRCYAENWAKRTGHDFKKVTKSKTQFDAPLHWKESRMIFVCSLSDFFIEDADKWRDEVWEIIRKTPRHIYQILTKRPENILDRLPKDWPLENCWLGVTAENQKMADERIPILLRIPAIVHFVSYEPLLEYIESDYNLSPIDWVLIGAESGFGARIMDEDWVRKMIDDAEQFGIPIVYKQKMVEGKKISLPLLDGKQYFQFPAILNPETFDKLKFDDDLRITDWLKSKESFQSQYGRVTSKKWLIKEGERFMKLGIETEIVSDKKDKLIALARKSEKIEEEKIELLKDNNDY